MTDFGTIILVPFPFTDLSALKVRPALVLSRPKPKSNDVIVCFITSRTDGDARHALRLESDTSTGLKVPSVALLNKIATLNTSVILGELGRISAVKLRREKNKFFDVFGF